MLDLRAGHWLWYHSGWGYPHHRDLYSASGPLNHDLHSPQQRFLHFPPQYTRETRKKSKTRKWTLSMSPDVLIRARLPLQHSSHASVWACHLATSVSATPRSPCPKVVRGPQNQKAGRVWSLWGINLKLDEAKSRSDVQSVPQSGEDLAQVWGEGHVQSSTHCRVFSGGQGAYWGAWTSVAFFLWHLLKSYGVKLVVSFQPHRSASQHPHLPTRTPHFKAFIYLVYHQRTWGIWWTISLLHPSVDEETRHKNQHTEKVETKGDPET